MSGDAQTSEAPRPTAEQILSVRATLARYADMPRHRDAHALAEGAALLLAEVDALLKQIETLRAPANFHNADHMARLLEVFIDTITELGSDPAAAARQVLMYATSAVNAAERETARMAAVAEAALSTDPNNRGLASLLNVERERTRQTEARALKAETTSHVLAKRVADVHQVLAAARAQAEQLYDARDRTSDRDRARRMERAANEIEGLADKVEAALGDDGGLTEKLLLAERRAALEGAITAVTEQQIEDAARHADDPQHGHGSWCHRGASTTCHGAEADATHNRVLDVLRGLLAALNPEGDDDRG